MWQPETGFSGTSGNRNDVKHDADGCDSLQLHFLEDDPTTDVLDDQQPGEDDEDQESEGASGILVDDEQRSCGGHGGAFVTLTRVHFEAWLPWGLGIDKHMIMHAPEKGSMGVSNEQVRGCVGM